MKRIVFAFVILSLAMLACGSIESSLPPEASFHTSLEKLLGNSNRGIKRLTEIQFSSSDGILIIKWALNDNFSNDMIKRGAMMDIDKMLKYVSQNDVPYSYREVVFDGSLSLVDSFGNSTEERVVLATYKKATIEKINWDNFITDNTFAIADSIYLHPAFSR